jgi:hypothetical protein
VLLAESDVECSENYEIENPRASQNGDLTILYNAKEADRPRECPPVQPRISTIEPIDFGQPSMYLKNDKCILI